MNALGELQLNILDRLDELATKTGLVVALVLTIILYAIIGFFNQQFLALSGGLFVPDMRFGYSLADIQQLFSTVGTDGLRVYSAMQDADTFLPIVYSLAISFGILIAIRNCPDRLQKTKSLGMFPLIVAIFDYAENILIATQVASYPTLNGGIIELASIYTTLKWVTLGISFLILIVFGVIAIVYSAKNRDRN